MSDRCKCARPHPEWEAADAAARRRLTFCWWWNTVMLAAAPVMLGWNVFGPYGSAWAAACWGWVLGLAVSARLFRADRPGRP